MKRCLSARLRSRVVNVESTVLDLSRAIIGAVYIPANRFRFDRDSICWRGKIGNIQIGIFAYESQYADQKYIQ